VSLEEQMKRRERFISTEEGKDHLTRIKKCNLIQPRKKDDDFF
jgi:hypothetical protein